MTRDQQTPHEYIEDHWRKAKTNTDTEEPGEQQRQVEKNTDYR